MVRRASSVLTAVLGAALLGCQAGPAPLSEADRAAIEEVSAQFVAHVRAQEWDALSQVYTEDAVLMPPNESAVRGRGAIRDWMAGLPPVTEFSLTNDMVEGSGDLAYVVGRYALSFGVEGNPSDAGKFVEIRRRGADGVWRMSVDIFNSDIPLPTGQ